MVIGINGYEAVVPRFGYDSKTGLPKRVGSSEYCFQLLAFLNKIDKKNNYLVYLPKNPTPDLPKENDNWRYKQVKFSKMWLGLGMSFEFLLKRPKLDVFFSPTHYLPLFAPYPSAISILDLSYLHFPTLFKKQDLFQLRYWTRYSVKRAKKIFTISKASKDDIIEKYGVKQENIIVAYPGIKKASGIKHRVLSMDDLKKKYGIDQDYILFVGTLQPRKNIVRLIEAFSKLKEKDLSLVIVGKKGWSYEEILQAPKKFGVGARVKFLDFVPDSDLPAFYKNALCFVLPSLYEGFGLPVLEAMQYGCPVITSNVSSLPEAGGDAVLYVNPLDVSDIAKNLELIINNSELRERLIKKGYEQVKKFSWEKTAMETLKVLEEVGKKN